MNQLRALIWLKWTLFRNSMRSRKAVLNRVASVLLTLGALGLALLIALGLGVAAYGFSSLNTQFNAADARALSPTTLFFFFMVFALIYLMWAIVPLGLGGGNQFDPGRLLLYPVSLRKLFVIDLISELTSLSSIFAVPVVLAVAVGAGVGHRNIAAALLVAGCAIAFGIALARWLTASLGSLMRRRRTRGETVLALIGALFGLGGAFLGQLTPVMARHGTAFRGLRWTPPGAVAVALTSGLQRGGAGDYTLALSTLIAYTALFIALTYWIARRSALGIDGSKRAAQRTPQAASKDEVYAGWKLPLLSPQLSAVVEKELRYALRNAQLRTLALMPLILIGVRLAQTSGLRDGESGWPGVASPYAGALALYGEGVKGSLGVLYVFMILSSLACNMFGYEGSGMRALVLAPVERRIILIGKNLVVTLIAAVFASLLMLVNQLVFHDLTGRALVFVAICFLLFASTYAIIGNWLSIRFPKRMQFGKRMNVTGVTGLLLIPILIVMALPPVLAALAGYLAQSLLIKYVTLLAFALMAVALYGVLISRQGRALAQREHEILEAVSEKEQ